jgi:hypothetical protein
MRRFILNCNYGPSANVLLTAAVRDLHKLSPGQFQTDVRTDSPEIWLGNPYISKLDDHDPDVVSMDCPPPSRSMEHGSFRLAPGILQYFSVLPEVSIRPTIFRGDLHLSRKERSWFSQIQELTGVRIPFWLVSTSGGSKASTRKWHPQRYQAVIDEFRDRILFVQVGTDKDDSEALSSVIDLRGKTDLRQLVRLVHHAQGVLTSPNLLMHLAAALDTSNSAPNRACVVVAGGSQSFHWQRYPTHQFLHTVGALPCCETTGCGRSLTHFVGEGPKFESPQDVCVDPLGDVPRCMDMLDTAAVTRAIQRYFDGGLLSYLSNEEANVARQTIAALNDRQDGTVWQESVNELQHAATAARGYS